MTRYGCPPSIPKSVTWTTFGCLSCAAALASCMADPAAAAAVAADVKEAEAIWVRSTPTFIIGGKTYAGALSIAELREHLGAPGATAPAAAAGSPAAGGMNTTTMIAAAVALLVLAAGGIWYFRRRRG